MSETQDTARVEYRPIEGFPGYRVGDDGSVWGCRNNHGLTSKWRKLKPWAHKSGHLYVSLCIGRKQKSQVHRLVLFSFVGDPPTNAHDGCHRDDDPTNNTLSNLKWGTRAENIADALRNTGKFPRCVLTFACAAEIRKRFTGKHGEKQMLAREFGVSASLVGRIINGRTYTAGVA